jgi:hypothetical protein
MLMEVYFAAPFEYLARKHGVDATEKAGSSGVLRYINANVVFEKCKSEIPENSRFHYAVEMCLDPTAWEDENGRPLDNDVLRPKIYQEIVQPLETELSQAYSSIPIEDLDKFAQGLDFANWDQPMPVWNVPGPAEVSMSNPGHPQQLLPALSPRSPSPSPSYSQHQSPKPQTLLQSQSRYFHGQNFANQGSTLPAKDCPLGCEVDYKALKFFDDETPSEAHTAQAYVIPDASLPLSERCNN